MKKLFFILSFLSFNIFAQTDSATVLKRKHFQNIIKFGPFHLVSNRLNLGYELLSKDHKKSINLSGSFLLKSGTGNDFFNFLNYNSNVKSSESYGLSGEFQVRFYLASVAYTDKNFSLNHIFVAPYFNLAYYNTKGTYITINQNFESLSLEKQYVTSLSAIGGGVVGGYQIFIFKDIISLDLYFGGGLRYSASGTDESGVYSEYTSKSSSPFDTGFTGVVPRIGFQIGLTL